MALGGLTGLLPRSLKTYYWRWHDGSLQNQLGWRLNAWKRSVFGESSDATLPYDWSTNPPRWSLIQDAISKLMRGRTAIVIGRNPNPNAARH